MASGITGNIWLKKLGVSWTVACRQQEICEKEIIALLEKI